MRRVGTALMALAVVMALMAIPIGVAAASDHTEERESITAGEQLGGVVSVQGAQLDGELSERTYGVRIANAETERAKASIVAERLTEIEGQIADHEAKLAELEAEREAGNISEGAYRAQVATLSAEQAATERAAERAGDTARGLPEDVLAERGVSIERIDELRANASRVGGPEQREIAGNNVSSPMGADRPQTSDRRPATDRPFSNATMDVTDGMGASDFNSGSADRAATADQTPQNDVGNENANKQPSNDEPTDRNNSSQASPNQ